MFGAGMGTGSITMWASLPSTTGAVAGAAMGPTTGAIATTEVLTQAACISAYPAFRDQASHQLLLVGSPKLWRGLKKGLQPKCKQARSAQDEGECMPWHVKNCLPILLQ